MEKKYILLLLVFVFLLASLFYFYSLGSKTKMIPKDIGLVDSRLQGCPKDRNCLYPQAWIFEDGADVEAWQKLVHELRKAKSYRFVRDTETYIHLEDHSSFWGIIEDVELHWLVRDGKIQFRSVSRVKTPIFSRHDSRYAEIQKMLGIFSRP